MDRTTSKPHFNQTAQYNAPGSLMGWNEDSERISLWQAASVPWKCELEIRHKYFTISHEAAPARREVRRAEDFPGRFRIVPESVDLEEMISTSLSFIRPSSLNHLATWGKKIVRTVRKVITWTRLESGTISSDLLSMYCCPILTASWARVMRSGSLFDLLSKSSTFRRKLLWKFSLMVVKAFSVPKMVMSLLLGCARFFNVVFRRISLKTTTSW